METPLQTPSPPVNILNGYVSPQQVTLNVYCHDRIFKKVTVTDSTSQPVFRVEGTSFGTSWSWRRKVFDSSNTHLFDFRHKSVDIKNGWIIENPNGDKLCSLVHKSQITRSHSAIDATVRTQVGEEVLVIMRPNDHAALATTISVDGAAIATIRKVEDNDVASLGTRDRSVWEVRVASGVDLSLIMILMLCRAEMCHVWRQ
ncbi:tubby C-terminal-like domain-containing protein [Daldinia vernicosa]|uniref:tubby C-terminal-like domain-containing protein n=1 Tax=Daldinia vernicosa TaxID=114800 RepID=UPI0020076B49|nr:tubby C-terminal-like domain-containing protein [Daldinia vernicosa]KAI0850326.1 tubby C-terminal-like domain-containing protein [Daldinia vernicosa]